MSGFSTVPTGMSLTLSDIGVPPISTPSSTTTNASDSAVADALKLLNILGYDPKNNPTLQWLREKGLFGIQNGMWNQIGTLGQLGMGAFNMWNAWQANKLNKRQMAFQQDAWRKQYNASLGQALQGFNDTLNSRAAMLGLSGDSRDNYVNNQLATYENRLKTGTSLS